MNKSLKILLVINSVFVFAGNLLGPLYAIFIENLGGSIAVVSGTWSIMLLATTLTNAILIKYGDSLKEHEYFLIGGYILCSFAWLGFIYAGSITTVIMIQILIGIAEAVGSTGFDAIFAEHLDKDSHIKDYATWRTFANIIAALATMVGGLVVTYYGFNYIFGFMAIVALGCAIYTYLLPRNAL